MSGVHLAGIYFLQTPLLCSPVKQFAVVAHKLLSVAGMSLISNGSVSDWKVQMWCAKGWFVLFFPMFRDTALNATIPICPFSTCLTRNPAVLFKRYSLFHGAITLHCPRRRTFPGRICLSGEYQETFVDCDIKLNWSNCTWSCIWISVLF